MRALIAILFLVSCSQDSMMLAKVNGDPITFGHFKARLREIEFDQTLVAPNDLLSLKKYILNEMIEEQIIQQQAEAMNVKMTPEDVTSAIEKNFSKEELEKIDENLRKQKISKDEWRERMRQKILSEKVFEIVTQQTPATTEEDLQQYYQKNISVFQQKEQVHIIQMVFSNKEEARQMQQRVLKGEDFATLAQNVSIGLDSVPHGDLGFVQRGILPEEVEDKVFSMKVGAVSPILESAPNFYLVKVTEKMAAKQLGFEDARQQIQNMLLQSSRDKTYTNWLQEKMIQAKIKRNDELLQENFSL